MERLISGNRYQGEADCTGGYPRGNHVSSVNYQCAQFFSWNRQACSAVLVQKLTALNGHSRPAENRSCVGSCTFPTMIASWRKHWHKASGGATPAQVPFGFMQLSTWSDKANGTCGDGLTHADSASCDVGVVSTATHRFPTPEDSATPRV